MVQLVDTLISKIRQVLVQIQLHAQQTLIVGWDLQGIILMAEWGSYTSQTKVRFFHPLPVISLRVEHGTDTSDTEERYLHHGHWLGDFVRGLTRLSTQYVTTVMYPAKGFK